MDPISIITTVISTAQAVHKWIDDLNAREPAIRELNTTVSRIGLILTPLQSNSAFRLTRDAAITSCLQDMGEVLSRAQEHLAVWKDKRSKLAALLSFVNPSTVLAELQQDERMLSQRMGLLAFALQVASLVPPHPTHAIGEAAAPAPTSLDEIANAEVKGFWMDKFGDKISCVDGTAFCQGLGAWLGGELDPWICQTLLLRLDEYSVGGVTPTSLEKFVGRNTLRQALSNLDTAHNASQQSRVDATVKPVLIWIDDQPENNRTPLDYARELEITTFVFTSTASAKLWINANEAMVRHADRAQRLLFISDNSRMEAHPRGGHFLNSNAGKMAIRFLRGRLFEAPILIYCGSLRYVSYVTQYRGVGATNGEDVCISFIRELAAGHTGNHWPTGFNVPAIHG